MRLRTFAVFLWGFLIATAAVAGEERRAEIKIAIDGDESGQSVFRFDSDDAGIDLYELEVGDKKTYTDDDGNEVTVSRNDDGFVFEVAGEEIVVADILHDEHDLKMIHLAHESENVVLEKHHKVHMVKTEADAGVTIISGDEIDADTRARIEKVLKEAGKDGEVLFIDGSELTGDEKAERKREVRIIKKEIDVTN
ncbi:MAG: hypothetical protein QNJ14_07820 [Woeseiaceae bacterium]|nr:hypothetical protein [Woeseiaceae bacterium]